MHSSPASTSTNNRNDCRYLCSICGFMSVTRHDFTKHIREHNRVENTKNFTCQVCHKVLSSFYSLNRHVLVHTGERSFTCKYCYGSFTTNSNMKQHRRNCTTKIFKMKLRAEFPCKLCMAVLPNLRALKGHSRIHLSSARYGPYRCTICPYSIQSKAAFFKHIRTHNGYRPYQCILCNFAFTLKTNCERHLRNQHGKTTRDEVKRSIIINHLSEDPVKKMEIYNSTCDDEEVISKDSISPVTNLKDISVADTVKIRVRSLDQLIKPNLDETKGENERPIDLSVAGFYLSPKTHEAEGDEEYEEVVVPTIDFSTFAKNQQIMAHQQFLSENFPKIDPTHYFQLSQIYRILMFPTAGFAQHFFMTHNNEHKHIYPKYRPRLSKFQPGLMESQNFRPPSQTKELQQKSSSPTKVHVENQQQLPSSTQRNNLIHNSGLVKMVIENGVLISEQTQRRYSMERQFSCDFCSARFILRRNRDQHIIGHIKQHYPQYWAQRQLNGHNILRRASGSIHSGQIIIPSTHTQPLLPKTMTTRLSTISDQVEFAILAHQLKLRSEKPYDYFMSMESTRMQSRNNIDNDNTFLQQQEDNEESELIIDEDRQPLDLSVTKRVLTPYWME